MLHSAGEPLLRRAQEAGIVRPDVTIDEVIRMVGGIAKIPTDEPGEIQRLLSRRAGRPALPAKCSGRVHDTARGRRLARRAAR